MLSLEQFAEQKRQLGHRIFKHSGWYWEEVYPFYCKPAYVYKPFHRGTSTPPRLRSVLGYDHQVCHPDMANQWRATMVLPRSVLDGFGMQALSSKKRNQVRRGLDRCAVRVIVDIDAWVERMHAITVAQVRRQEKRAGAPYSAADLMLQAEIWKSKIRREFKLPGRDWWGAFVGDEMTAYARTYWVEGDLVFQQTKLDVDFGKSCPMDALYFSILEDAAGKPGCSRVINGRPMHASLNHFKNEYLFHAINYPYYYSYARMTSLAKRAWMLKALLLRAFRQHKEANLNDR